MCKTNQERRTLGRNIVAWLSLGVFLSSQTMAMAVPIMPDNQAPITERPLVQETANHIPLVNITAPTNGGVSMNKYEQFNVETQGAILNNSYTVSKTELAGFVQGNSNMMNGTAKVIVNQVTSDTPTSMNGYLEVAGQRASVVVANPNGIAVNGGGFLNTSHAVLTTGKPEFDAVGNVTKYRVEDGRVSIHGAGLDAKTTDSVAILSRAADINAGIWANELAVRNGVNDVDANTLDVTSIEGAIQHGNDASISISSSGSGLTSSHTKPVIALDVAAVGGMYANHISLVGTEHGVGVNVAGVVAGTQSVSLDANGHVSVSGTLQSDKVLSAKANSIDNTKTIASGGTLVIDTKDLTNTGFITSAGHGQLKVDHTLDNRHTIAAGANTEGAITTNGSLSIEIGTLRNTDAVIVSGGTTKIHGTEVHNVEHGRIYGGKVHIEADTVENRKNVGLEAKLADAMKDMKVAEDSLEAAYAVDTTAFTTKAEQDAYLNNIKEKYKDYDVKLAAVKAVQSELEGNKGSTIAGQEDVTIKAKNILNAEKSLIYSGNTATLIGTDNLINHGGTIDVLGKGFIKSANFQNTNSSFTAKRVSEQVEKVLNSNNPDDMLETQENKIRIDDGGHSESGQAFPESEFTDLGSGYGAHHRNGKATPMVIYDDAIYEPVEQITPDEEQAGETRIPDAVVGTLAPTYAYDDEVFKTFGITSLSTPRPDLPGPEQDAWDAQFKPILAALNEKIQEHNAKAKAYNKQIAGVASEKIDRYTIIRTNTLTSHEEVQSSTAGVVRFGGDVQFEGKGTNENSQIAIGGTLTTEGTIDQVAKQDQEMTHTFGTTEATYTYKRKWPHKSRRRGYKGQVFMTPQVDKGNETPLGVAKQDDKDSNAKTSVGDKHRKDVQDFLNPFAVADSSNNNNGTVKPNAGSNILNLPTSSLYQIHPDVTAKYLVETDPQFANRKKFLSSDYMYREMKTKPELVEKRLGDGLYEQTLIREQIVKGTGFRFLDGYTDDEAQFKALMDAGIAYAKASNLVPGVSLSAEQMAHLTSDMVWLEKATVMVDGQPVEVIYPKVYLKNTNGQTSASHTGNANNSNLILKTDGTLLSANKLIMNAKETIKNEGIIQGKMVILHSATDVNNNGHIVGGQIGVQAGNTINNQGQIIAQRAIELQAKNDINLNNTVDHLTNQDVLNTTSGIAVTGDNGIMVVNAGHDVNLGAATLEALGKDGSIIITAGNDVNSTTDTVSAKKDMTQNSENYLRTYRKTELGTTIEASGNISIGAKHDVNARNLTISSDDGAVKVIGEHDTSIVHGYSESKDAYGIKYKETGFLNKKETKVKTNNESKDALMSTISGTSVLVGANHDITLTGTNVVSTEETDVLAGHNIHTDAAEEYALSESSKEVKKSGLMGAGIGFMIGKQQSKDNYRTEETTHRATTLGATNGKVTVQAGDTAHLTTTNAIGETGVTITAQEIILDGNEDAFKSEERHERKSSGLTVSLGGSVVENIDGAIKKQHTASSRHNNNFKQLESKQARDRLGKALVEAKQIVDNSYNGQMRAVDKQLDAIDTRLKDTTLSDSERAALRNTRNSLAEKKQSIENNKQNINNSTDKAIDRAINLQIGIGSSKSVSESKTEQRNYAGGTIDSDGTVLIYANSEDAIKGNIKMVGEEIHGRQVTLEATNDIDLQAATNTLRTESSSTASGWGLSANIGLRTGNIVGGSASVYKATEQGIETGTTHTGTHMVADDVLHITSGKDTNLIGSTATGASVKASIGGNLTVESLQDTNSYHETSRNKGISVSTADMTHFGVSGANVKGHIDSDYKSVTQQAGIHAGAKGIDITVGDTTTLKGAIITSTATPDNNKLSTKQLITEDIQNEASYNAKQSGVSMNTSGFMGKGILGKINPLGLSPVVTIPVSDSASSTTRSAISENIILDVENKSAADINRDTEHALNSIKPIFDKDDVKERLAYVNAVSAEGFKLIGDISLKQQLKYEAKARNEDNIELKTKYLSEAQKWSEGGAYKVALHGAFGAYLGDLSGGSAVKGFTVGASNEYLNKMLDSHRDANLHKWFSAIVGHAVDSSMGSAMALSATTHNWLTHGDQVNLKYDLVAYKDNPGMIVKKLAYYDSLMDFEHEYNSVYKTSNYLTQDLYDYLLANDSDILTDGRYTSFSDVMYNLKQKYVFSQGSNSEIEFNDQKAYQSARILSDKSGDVMFRELLSNTPASNDWRDATVNRHAESFAGVDGHYTRVAEESMPKVYDNEGDRLADNGAHVITLSDGNNYAITGRDNIQFSYTNRQAQYSEKEFGNAIADQMVPVYPPNPPYMTTPYILYNGRAFSTNRAPTVEVAGTNLAAIGADYAFQRAGAVVDGKSNNRIVEEYKNPNLDLIYNINKPLDGVHLVGEYKLNTGKENIIHFNEGPLTIDLSHSNVNTLGKVDVGVKPGSIIYGAEGKFSVFEIEGELKIGNDIISLEAGGAAGIGVVGKIAVGTKSEGESSSLELGTAKLSEGLYMEGDVKIKSNLLQGIEEKKNEVKKNTESYLKTKGEN